MLKHTTTANADHQRTYSNKQQNGSLRNNHVGATTTRISSPEPVLITTPESSDSKATSSARCALEPEYQNTNAAGRVHSPSSSPFFRDTQLNKSVRSVESICATAASANNNADSSVQYNKYHNQWNRPGPGGSVKVPLDTSLLQSGSGGTRLPSRNSVLNHSYAGIAGYPYQQHQRSFSPNIQQRLNQSEIVGLSAGPPPPKLFNTSLNLPNGSIGLSGTPKLIANGGLHISKSSNVETKDSLLLDSSRLNSTVIATATVGGNILGRSYEPDKEETLNGNGGHAVGSSGKNSRNAAAMIASDIFNNGVKEILTSLGLLCLISLLLALLSLIFLLKISPVTAADMKNLLRVEQFTIISPDEYVTVYEVTLALCALSLSLNLCCLLVCSVQFLFAVKLVRSSVDGDRTNKYLQKSSITRVCAIAGFFISIPVFLTGVILYTFIQFHSTPAIITSVLIGSGIVFCGCAMVHNVFIWQKEKTNAVRAIVRRQKIHRQLEASRHSESSNGIGARDTSATALSTMSSLPTARAGITELNSVATTPHELSTLV